MLVLTCADRDDLMTPKTFHMDRYNISRRKLLIFTSLAGLVPCLAATKSTQSLPWPANFPRPKFYFGQPVYSDLTVDDKRDPNDGKILRDFGVVIGMVLNPPGFYIDGWVYYIKWSQMNSTPGLSLPYISEVPEDELNRCDRPESIAATGAIAS